MGSRLRQRHASNPDPQAKGAQLPGCSLRVQAAKRRIEQRITRPLVERDAQSPYEQPATDQAGLARPRPVCDPALAADPAAVVTWRPARDGMVLAGTDLDER